MRKQIVGILNHVSNYELDTHKIPFFQFGKKNFESSVEAIFWKIQVDSNYGEKYVYEKKWSIEIKSAHVSNFFNKYQLLTKQLESLKQCIE